ncbi:MAG: YlxR family protein [Actinomycetota bacterium]
MSKADPERTCVGCRTRGPKGMLLRVVRSPGGEIRADPSGTAPGRGAYVHRADECLRVAIGGSGLARSFRAPLPKDGAARLMEELRREVRE